jgi:hypothetical protein
MQLGIIKPTANSKNNDYGAYNLSIIIVIAPKNSESQLWTFQGLFHPNYVSKYQYK